MKRKVTLLLSALIGLSLLAAPLSNLVKAESAAETAEKAVKAAKTELEQTEKELAKEEAKLQERKTSTANLEAALQGAKAKEAQLKKEVAEKKQASAKNEQEKQEAEASKKEYDPTYGKPTKEVILKRLDIIIDRTTAEQPKLKQALTEAEKALTEVAEEVQNDEAKVSGAKQDLQQTEQKVQQLLKDKEQKAAEVQKKQQELEQAKKEAGKKQGQVNVQEPQVPAEAQPVQAPVRVRSRRSVAAGADGQNTPPVLNQEPKQAAGTGSSVEEAEKAYEAENDKLKKTLVALQKEEADLQNLTKTFNEKQEDVNGFEESAGKLKTRKQEIEETLKTKERQYEENKAKLDEQRELLKTLNINSPTGSNSRILVVKQVISNLEAQEKTLLREKEDTQKAVTEIGKEVQSAEQKVQEAKQALHQAEEAKTQQEQKVQQLTATKQQQEQTVQQKQEALNQAKAAAQKQNQNQPQDPQQDQAANPAPQQDQTEEKFKKELAKLKKKIEKEIAKTEKITETDANKQEKADVLAGLQALEQALNELEKSQDAVAEKQTKLEANTNTLKGFEARTKTLKAQEKTPFDLAEQAAKDELSKAQDAQKEFAQTAASTQDKANLQQEINALEAELEAIRQDKHTDEQQKIEKVQEVKDKIAKALQKPAEIKAQMQTLQERVAEIKQKAETLKQQLDAVKQQNKALAAQIEQLLEERQQVLDKLNTITNDKNTAIATLLQDVQKEQEALDEAINKGNKIQTDNQELAKLQAQYEQKLQELTNSLKASAKRSPSAAEIAAMQEKIDKFANDYKAILADGTSSLAEKKQKLQEVENKSMTLAQTLEQFKTKTLSQIATEQADKQAKAKNTDSNQQADKAAAAKQEGNTNTGNKTAERESKMANKRKVAKTGQAADSVGAIGLILGLIAFAAEMRRKDL